MSSSDPGNSGSDRLAAILANSSQPGQPQNAAFRSRGGVQDSENVDPWQSDILAQILGNGAPPAPAGSSGDGPGPDGDTSSNARRAGFALAAMTTAVTGANLAVSGFTNRVLQANARLAEWNGEVAKAVGLAQARQIERDIRQGEGVGNEYARLDEANQEYRDMMTEVTVPLQAAAMDVLAGLGEFRNVVMGSVLPGLTFLAEQVHALAKIMSFGKVKDPINSNTAARKFLSDLSDGKFDGVGTSYMNPGNRPLMSDADRIRIFGP
ncbi:MAG: hypothetical protein CMP95_02685 [Gammaproteobacteria bacterium]|nr:hypothetical protein [Gammaproteobacteria bacterium]|tara:strand:+ start:3500 stop:4297 length:798 start_codon:yes stop_codon:yes gene_type:complete